MAKKKEFNLGSLYTKDAANEGFDVQIFDAQTHEDLGLVIRVLGKDSDEFQKVRRNQEKKRLAKMQKGGFRNTTQVQIEEIEQDAIALLAACTKSWKFQGKNTIPGPDGKEMELTLDNAILFYTESPSAREQVDTAIGDRSNFIKS